MAEGVGFEPTETQRTSTAFEAVPFVRSGILPSSEASGSCLRRLRPSTERSATPIPWVSRALARVGLQGGGMTAGSRLRSPASADRLAPPLPPPSREAVPSPGPVVWSPLGPTRSAEVIVGREVADAFELIWPTGEIDGQFLGWPLSEAPCEAVSDAPQAIGAARTPDDVVFALRRAIGPDPGAMDQSALLPCLPERSPGTTVPEVRRSAFRRLIRGLRSR